MRKLIRSDKRAKRRTTFVLIGVIIIVMLISGTRVFADTEKEGEHGASVESILKDIRAKQGLGPNGSIDPRKVSNRDLEELGDAVMGLMFPDPEQHEYMDNMMGGEGSRSLELMHRRMGYNYLAGKPYDFNDVRREIGGGRRGGSAEEREYEGHDGMMGPGMMSFGFRDGMMGNGFGYDSYWGFIMGIIILAAIGVVVYLIIRYQRTGGRTGDRLFGEPETPLEIARKRYARGEITREEFEEIKQNL